MHCLQAIDWLMTIIDVYDTDNDIADGVTG